MKTANAGIPRSMVAAAALAVLVACGAAYLLAPAGSTLTLNANPTTIASNGDVSNLTAFVFEPIGTPVADGTVVFWSTNLGQVDPETRTRNGVARNRLISDSRSGRAEVCAFLGTEGAAPPTTTATTVASHPSVPRASVSVFAASGAVVACSGEIEEVVVGNERVRNVRLRIEPSRIPLSTGARTTTVIATVFGESGNPVPNVPVYFEIVNTADRFTDHFDSSGEPRFTNNNGEAEDIFRTRRNAAGSSTVRACVPGPGTTGTGMICSDPFVIVMQ